MEDHLEQVALAFSRKAAVYDAFGEDHPNLERMRSRVRAHVLRYLPPGGRILEINAGTGSDAVYFAQRGFRVHATDISHGMVSEIRNKIELYGLGDQLTVERRSFTELGELPGETFDLVISNMGGLNCIPDLAAVTRQLPGLLKRNGTISWVIMPPFCLWELAAIFAGDWRTAVRRWGKGGRLANVEGVQFLTYYFTPTEVQRSFGPRFQRLELEGLSVFTPPADRKAFPRRYPRLFRALCWLDDRLSSRWPFKAWGDFFILTLRFTG